jgi:hypothetical protein
LEVIASERDKLMKIESKLEQTTDKSSEEYVKLADSHARVQAELIRHSALYDELIVAEQSALAALDAVKHDRQQSSALQIPASAEGDRVGTFVKRHAPSSTLSAAGTSAQPQTVRQMIATAAEAVMGDDEVEDKYEAEVESVAESVDSMDSSTGTTVRDTSVSLIGTSHDQALDEDVISEGEEDEDAATLKTLGYPHNKKEQEALKDQPVNYSVAARIVDGLRSRVHDKRLLFNFDRFRHIGSGASDLLTIVSTPEAEALSDESVAEIRARVRRGDVTIMPTNMQSKPLDLSDEDKVIFDAAVAAFFKIIDVASHSARDSRGAKINELLSWAMSFTISPDQGEDFISRGIPPVFDYNNYTFRVFQTYLNGNLTLETAKGLIGMMPLFTAFEKVLEDDEGGLGSLDTLLKMERDTLLKWLQDIAFSEFR